MTPSTITVPDPQESRPASGLCKCLGIISNTMCASGALLIPTAYIAAQPCVTSDRPLRDVALYTLLAGVVLLVGSDCVSDWRSSRARHHTPG